VTSPRREVPGRLCPRIRKLGVDDLVPRGGRVRLRRVAISELAQIEAGGDLDRLIDVIDEAGLLGLGRRVPRLIVSASISPSLLPDLR
jgi:hypothetical protein